MTKIIAFTGKKRVGKSTACKIIEVLYPNKVTRLSFKKALLEEVKEYFPDVLGYCLCSAAPNIDSVLEEKPYNVRQLLQNFGTNFRRAEDPEYWVNKWKSQLSDIESEIVVVDDLRFLNEANAVKSTAGIIIRLKGNTEEIGDNHQSETEMDLIGADYEIEVEEGNIKKMVDDIYEITNKEIWM